MIWLIALVTLEVIALVALVTLAVRWGEMTIKDVLSILGVSLVIAAVASIGIWALVYGLLGNVS